MRQVEALSWSVHLLLCLGLTEPFLKPGKQKTRPDQTPHCVCFTICEPPWEFGGDCVSLGVSRRRSDSRVADVGKPWPFAATPPTPSDWRSHIGQRPGNEPL